MEASNTHVGISFEIDPKDKDQIPELHLVNDDRELDKAERTPLTEDEKVELAECVASVKDNIDSVQCVAASLCSIKVSKLYRETHASFAKFCKDTFQMSRSQAYRLADEHEVNANFKDASKTDTAIPDGNGQTRVVSGFTPEEQLKVGARVKQIAGDRPATAKDWTQGRQELLDEGEITAPVNRKKTSVAKTPGKKANDPEPTGAKDTSKPTIDPNLMPLKTLLEKAERCEKLPSTSKCIMEKAKLWKEILLGLQGWAGWEEQQLNQQEAA